MFRLLTCLAFYIYPVITFSQKIQININSLPETPSAEGIYIAGSFNQWNPKNEQFKFQKNENGIYSLTIQIKEGSYEYKVTRGGWDKVECSKEGKSIGNRQLVISSNSAVIDISIGGWQDQFTALPKKSSASKNVKIISTNFLIPQLNRTRRIWAYLPPGYENSKERYPVLYMHDGQNLFEDTSSFSGEWGVDEFMDTVRSGKCIVIGIDNGGGQRLSEYAPYDFKLKTPNSETKIEAKGDEYIDFIVKTLKPYIDKTYRTKKDKKNTLIAGSSMGGLISMYAVIRYPKIFGGVGVFSPSFWTSTEIIEALKKEGRKIRSNIYFYAGKREGEQMVSDMLKAMETLSAGSKSKIKTVIRDEGQHNEPRWRIEFPAGYEWMRQL